MIEPVLKWAGGKRQILDSIVNGAFPPEDEYDRYHEPFFGGGAVFFRECSEKGATINDINSRLMDFYRVVRDRPNDLISRFNELNRPPGSDPDPDLPYERESQKGREIESYYYQLRAIFNERVYTDDYDAVREAAIFAYLNRTCFNGLYRENGDGEFNVPQGDQSKVSIDLRHRIKTASSALQGVSIHDEDYKYIEEHARESDLVYFDPPYDPQSSSSSFVEYTSDTFGKEDQRDLKDLAWRLDRKGVRVVISNAPSMRDLYERAAPDFTVKGVGARRAINSDGENRGKVEEVIITNVDNPRHKLPGLDSYS